MLDAQANFAISTVATAPTPPTSGTTIVVQSGHGARFPTAPFNASVWQSGSTPDSTNAEIVRVTACTSDTFTVTRTQESTIARSISVGDVIAATVTAKTFSDLTATYTQPTGTTIALVGTSITNNLGVMGGYQFSTSYWGWASAMLGHRFDLLSIDGIPGTGCTDSGFAARIATATASSAQWVLVEALTNDISGGQTLTAIQTAITTTIATVRAAGKRIIILTCPPRNSLTTAQQLIWGQVNTWLRQLPVLYPGVVVPDVASYLTDPTSSTPAQYVSTHTGDGVHPTPLGSKQMGAAIYAALSGVVPPGNLLGPQSDSGNWLTYNATSWAGGSSAFPTAWSGGATGATWSQPSRSDGLPGVVQRVVVPTAGVAGLHAYISRSYNTGDRFVGYLEVLGTSSIEASPAANTQNFYVYLQAYTAAYGNAAITAELNPNGTQPNVPPITAAHVLATPVLTVPSNGLQEIDFFIQIGGGGTYDFGRVGIVKVESSY